MQYRLCLADAEDEDTALFEAKDDPVAMPVARITLHDISIQPGKYDLDEIKSVRMQFTTGPPEVSAPCLSAVGVLAACATIMRSLIGQCARRLVALAVDLAIAHTTTFITTTTATTTTTTPTRHIKTGPLRLRQRVTSRLALSCDRARACCCCRQLSPGPGQGWSQPRVLLRAPPPRSPPLEHQGE